MNRTREDFCRRLLDDHLQKTLNPEWIADRFVRYFDVSAHPTLEQLKALLKQTGFGEVSGSRHMDAKGIHYSSPNGGYDIHYREDLWEGTKEFSVVHEAYEIINETLFDIHSGSQPDREVCTQADRFAAAVLMQPGVFGPMALEWGLDVLRLQQAFRCSYAAVAIRLTEVLRDPPLMVVVYGKNDRRDSLNGAGPSEMRAIVARRTRGFGTPVFPVCGSRGGIPRRGRPIPERSLAEQAAHYRTPRFAQRGGYAVIARPVVRQGKVTKVVVLAVPEGHASVLEPQIAVSDGIGRRRNPLPATATVGPW